MVGLLRFETVESMDGAKLDPSKVYKVPTISLVVHEDFQGLAPAGGASLTMGSWGARRQLVDVVKYDITELMYVTGGEVEITELTTGMKTRHEKGDIFIVPKGLKFAWDQSDDFTKHYVIADHHPTKERPAAVICYDREQPCTETATTCLPLAPGSGEAAAASHSYFTSPCGQISAGVWTCGAHSTAEGKYAIDEFCHILEGSVCITTADSHEHSFEAGDSVFIPKGLRCSWRQPVALKKCYIEYRPAAVAAASEARL